jgi:ADP-ribosylglycohydrolase
MIIKDAVWGFIVGDALGVPYEFSTRNMMSQNPAVDMVGYGTYNQPPGTWSDDTSMMLCVLENIINKGTTKDLAQLFLKWYKEDYMTPHGELFDIGITTSTALGNLMRGVKPSQSGLNDEMAAGNGSLMRCLPYAFVTDFHESVFNMVMDNRITHRHHLCSLSCMYYVKMMRALLDGKDKQEVCSIAAGYLRKGWRLTDAEDDHLETRKIFQKLFDPNFSTLPESEIQSTGYVISTLEAAVWCFLNTANYKDAVLKAVNLGSDTDTIAALTGGLAGLYYGYDTIPENWINQIAAPKMINKILDRLNPQEKYISW